MLHYQVPQLLFEALEDINALDSNHQQKTVLDLGCGTGLIGQLIHRYTKELIGIDIASEMIKCAKERQIYHQLYQEDILACLNEHFIDANVDLMILGDVFPYIGDMEEYFNVFQQCLKPKGHIAFSIEYQPNDQKKPFLLQPSARFCHSQHYIETLAKSHHLEVVYQRKRVLRRQNDQDIQGMIFILESH